MKITILNGNPKPSTFDHYLAIMKTTLEAGGGIVTQLDLRDLPLKYCIGCFGCWVKTPGQCVARDASVDIDRAIIHSDFTLWASPLKMGFPSALLKMALDKSIPLIHPYFVVDHGEAHHRPRYERYPRLGLLVEAEPDTDEADLEIVATILSRTALNMKSRLEFAHKTDTPAGETARRILAGPVSYVPLKRGLTSIPGSVVEPPKHLTIFNGSPRGRKGNTPIMLGQFGEGFASIPGHAYETHHLNRLNDLDQHRQRFAAAECVWLGFPLYTDAMPGIVKTFIETLEPLRGRVDNPPIGFLVQSGFPEAHHSRYIERYLHKLADRLGAPYLGTIVKGGGEGVRMMPEDANRKLFQALSELGSGFAQTGGLAPDLLPVVAGVERYPAILGPAFRLFLRTPIASWYWDSQLKENGAYQDRFAQPYMENLQ